MGKKVNVDPVKTSIKENTNIKSVDSKTTNYGDILFGEPRLKVEDVVLKDARFKGVNFENITPSQLKLAESIAKDSGSSFLRRYGPSAGLGLGALYLAGS